MFPLYFSVKCFLKIKKIIKTLQTDIGDFSYSYLIKGQVPSSIVKLTNLLITVCVFVSVYHKC